MEFCNGGGLEKTDAPIRMSKKCDDTYIRLDTVLALDKRTDGRTDGQTDRQTELVKQYRALRTIHADAR